MNELLTFIVLFTLSLWLLARPHEAENYNSNIMQGHLRRLWQDAYQNLSQNNISRAERSLLALLKLDAKNVGAYSRLGRIYAGQGMRKEAIECFEIASSINPSAGSLHNLAIIYFSDQQYEKAARTFEQAADKDPENPARRVSLATTLSKMGDTKGAIKELEKAHKTSPGSQASKLLSEAYRQIDAPDLAQQVEEESRKLKALAEKSS